MVTMAMMMPIDLAGDVYYGNFDIDRVHRRYQAATPFQPGSDGLRSATCRPSPKVKSLAHMGATQLGLLRPSGSPMVPMLNHGSCDDAGDVNLKLGSVPRVIFRSSSFQPSCCKISWLVLADILATIPVM